MGSLWESASGDRNADREDRIIQDYLGGRDVVALAHLHHRTNRTISRILRDAGVLGTLQRRRDEARRGRPSLPHVRGLGLTGQPSGPQWAYIAGFFDGEGSIGVRTALDAPTTRRARGVPRQSGGPAAGPVGTDSLRNHVRYRVSIVQKDPAPLAWICETVGAGNIYFANGTHRYQLQSQRAVFEFLLGVHRFLVVKRPEAEAALTALAASYGWARE